MCVSFRGQVQSAGHQALGNEGVVHSYDQQGGNVENEERGRGVDSRVQVPSVRIRGTCNKALICGGDVKGVKVREDSFGDCQNQGYNPNERRPQENGGSGARRLDLQGFHNGPVPGRHTDLR